MWMDASHIVHAATSQLKWWLCAFTLSGRLPVINLVTVWWMQVCLTSFWGGEVLKASEAGDDDFVFEFSWAQTHKLATGSHFISPVWIHTLICLGWTNKESLYLMIYFISTVLRLSSDWLDWCYFIYLWCLFTWREFMISGFVKLVLTMQTYRDSIVPWCFQ